MTGFAFGRQSVHMRFLATCMLISGLASPVMAEVCPPAPDHSQEMSDLIEAARNAPDASQARDLSRQMWALWADAPDETSQAILDRGMRRREAYDLLGAHQEFERLIAYCPDYAEGYNQRAFVSYLRQDFAAALMDLNRAIELSPTHVAAIAGRALSLMGLGRTTEAQLELRRALELNPWIPERGLLQKLPGKDL